MENQILKSQQILQERKRKEAKEKERNKKLIYLFIYFLYIINRLLLYFNIL